jgi:hypothetical protein
MGRFGATIFAVKKGISITYYERVFLALVIHHAMRMRRIVFCNLSGCKIFFHIIL